MNLNASYLCKFLDRLNDWVRPYVQGGPFDAAICITLVFFLIERSSEPQLLILSGLAIIVRPLSRSPVYWILLTGWYVGSQWPYWSHMDNHLYLFAYWCLAIILSLFSQFPEDVLAKSARWLLGLVFFFAVLWKLLSIEYLNGYFFEYALLADIRLSPVSLVLGLSGETLSENRDLLSMYIFGADPTSQLTLTTSPWVPFVAKVLTWWILLSETAVAIVFLAPTRWFSDFWRHGSMLVFLYTTYPMAQVSGFGWILTAMGISQLKRSSKPIYLALYLGAFLVVFFSKHPGIRGILQHMNFL
ncbi:MAG: hypothetical protein O3C43_12400 [Verrucomicrobia bacterium]|nr:hypothetical protein [Verrucomicrobiota bacterium]MDA1067293.1 hypothetical protein [Verrucomicrobiota bacterium]